MTPSSASNRLTRLFQQDRGLLIVLLVIITLIALPVLTYPLGRDQGEFATIARGILEGRVPYTQLWNPKPPAVFYVYALAIRLFGQTSSAIRAIDFFIVPVISLALYWIGRRVANHRVGLWAALIFPVFYFTETFWTLTQNDGLVLVPMVLAVVCVFKALDSQARSRYIWFGLAGALCAYAVWFKYPFALFGLVLVIQYVCLMQRPAGTNWLMPLLKAVVAFALGGLIVVGGGILFMQSLGAWDELVLSARVTASYTALTFDLNDMTDLMRTAIGFRWQQWGLLWVLSAVWFFVGRWGEKRGRAWPVVVIWALVGLAIMLIQAKGYDYHWLPMLPPLVLLGADTVDRLTELFAYRISRSIIVAVTAFIFLVILTLGIWRVSFPYLISQEDQETYYSHFVAGEFTADESLKVINYLKAHNVPGDSLYIWGFRPEVYYMSGLNPATRFIFQFPLVGSWYPQEWKKENVDTLWAALPPYVLVLQVDYMPWVTGSHEDSNTLLQSYTDLNNWLVYNYDRDTQIGNFFIWKRKPKP